MKEINVTQLNADNVVVDKFKVSGFDIIITEANGEEFKIKDGLPELLLGNFKLKSPDGKIIEQSEIITSIDATKLGLDVAVLGGMIDGADVQENQNAPHNSDGEQYEKKLKELLSENKKLKEQLSEATYEVAKQESPEKEKQIAAVNIAELPVEQVPEVPLNQISLSRKKVLLTDDGAGATSSNNSANMIATSQNESGEKRTVTPLSANLYYATDSGVIGDNITNNSRPIFTGITVPFAKVRLTIGGQSYFTNADDHGHWDITVTTSLPEGSNLYTVDAIEPNGNTGFFNSSIVIDTKVQDTFIALDSDSDTGYKGDFITQVTSPTLNGTTEAEANLTLQIDGNIYTFNANTTGAWSFTLPYNLNEGIHNYTLTATDKAGNTTTIQGLLTIDITGPKLTQYIDPSNDILIGNIISNEKPTFSGQTEPGGRVTISIAYKTYDVIADESGDWSFTVPVSLENGTWDYEIISTDIAGNQTILKDKVVIQHQPHVDYLNINCTLDINTNSGSTDDNITNNNTPRFSGETQPGATVTLSIAGKDYSSIADQSGNWSITVDDSLSDGMHDYTVTALGTNGATGVFNGYVTIDTELPDVNVSLSPESDTGVRYDDLTNVATPLLTGITEPNSIVTVAIGGESYKTMADISGRWNIQLTKPLLEGTNDYQVTVTDVAGNSNNATGSLTLDTKAPSLSGIKFGDGFDDRASNTYTPTITGWGEVGATVNIIIGSRHYSVVVPANRQWQFKVPAGFIAAGNKVQYIKFIETDAAGNSTEQTIKFQFFTQKPVITADLSVSTDTDTIGDKITSNTKPILTGTVSSNGQTPVQIAKAKISIAIDGKIYENISVDKNGDWAFQLPTNLDTGYTYNYTVTVTDFVGNKNTYESYVTISALSASLDAVSVTGQLSNSETSDVTPTLSGTAVANSTLSLLINNQTYSITASADGNWTFKLPSKLGDGSYDYKIIEKTVDGKTNTFNGNFVVDTKPPTILTAGLEEHAQHNISMSYRPDITLKGNTEAFALITIVIGGITYQTRADERGHWAYSFGKNEFLINSPYAYHVTASDAAGNKISINGNFVIDTITVSAKLDTNSNSGDASDNITNISNPTINGITAPDAKVYLEIGGRTYSAISDNKGVWSITVDELTDNSYNYNITAEKEGKVNYTSGSVIIDTSSITPTVGLDENSDSGVKNDNITNDSTPILNGLAEAGAKIQVTINGQTYTTIAGNNGHWSLEITSPLQEGANNYTIHSEDKAGNISEEVMGQITLDTYLAVPTVGLLEKDNSGFVSDNITNITTPSLTGVTEAGATVSVKINGNSYSTIAGEDGAWTVYVTNDLHEGNNEYIVQVEDIAGNINSAAGNVVIDTKPPVITDIKLLETPDLNNSTGHTLTTFSGKVDDINATLTISFTNDSQKHPITVNSDGSWVYEHSSPFAPGKYDFTIEATDKAGNYSFSSSCFEVVNSPLSHSLIETTTPVEIEISPQTGANFDLSINNDLYPSQGNESIPPLNLQSAPNECLPNNRVVSIGNNPMVLVESHKPSSNEGAEILANTFVDYHANNEDYDSNHHSI